MSQPVAFVTGCSSGIGRALADAFQRAGYRVWASARKEDDVRALAEAGFQAVQLDVNDAAALARLAEELGVEAAGLDVLVNNAGYGAMGPLLDGGVEAMRRQFETNVFAVVGVTLSLIHISEPTRQAEISYAVFCLKKKKTTRDDRICMFVLFNPLLGTRVLYS